MSDSKPAPTAGRRTRSSILAALVVVSAAATGVLGWPSWAVSSSSATSPIVARSLGDLPNGSPHRDRRGALGIADGVVPEGVTVFDDDVPAVANLDRDLLGALRRAAADAAAGGRVVFFVNSGWRSPEYQEHLLDEAIEAYGSREEAASWVATADTSAHVSGDAVDIGHSDATAWLSEHGAEYGLCQTYRNEPWHFELRPDAIDDGCPPMYADATHDPRTQQ